MTRAVHAIWGSRWGNRLPLDQLRRLALGLVLAAFTPGFRRAVAILCEVA
jgi:hypothetical protein